MMEKDDKLIQDFLQGYKQELADNGFSHRVMQQLPTTQRAQLWSDLLNVACIMMCCIWFYACDGIHTLGQLLENLFTWQAYQLVTQGSAHMLVATLMILTGIGLQRLWSLKA